MIERVLLIGSGSIGRRHLKVLRNMLPEAGVTLLRRPNPPELDSAVKAQVDRIVTDIGTAIDPAPDMAVIASPAPTHIHFARILAETGVPMLIEKPLGADLAGCTELADICRTKNLPVLVGYTLRYHPGFIALAAQVKDGAIGRPLSLRAEVGQYLPEWRPAIDYRKSVTAQRALGGGALLELSHEIDLVRALLGMPHWVAAKLDRLGELEIDVEDTVEMMLRHRTAGGDHAIASIHLDLLQRPARRRFVVSGTEATLELDFIANRLTLHRPDGQTEIAYPVMTERDQLYAAELGDLLQAIRSGTAPHVGLRDGIETMQIVEAARRSSSAGQPVTLSEAA